MRAALFPFLVKSASAQLVVLAMAMLCATVAAQPSDEVKRVLMLFTHQSDQPAQVIVEQAMRSTLRSNLSEAPEIYAEYLDAVRTSLDDSEDDLVRQLQRKYKGKSFDLIFAINPPALKFL